jgi:oligoribonuclease NrnB/cAMP/cGMP phosphodiesterase (DHH superfamily)
MTILKNRQHKNNYINKEGISMIYVLYHLDKDGQGSAYAAWKKFKNKAIYLPVNYGKPVPQMDDGAEVYIVDFSYKPEILLAMAERMEKVVVLDHHKTAQVDLESMASHPNLQISFDLTRSGASIAWEYFNRAPLPDLLKFIQDRDLWLFGYPESKPVHEFLCSFSYSPELWDYFVNAMPISYMVEQGNVLMRAREKIVSNLCYNAFESELDGHKVMAVNSPLYQSEIGHKLLDDCPDVAFVVIYSDPDKKRTVFSMRSKGDFDVSVIAKAHGGGGHKNAAGFEVETPAGEFPLS